MAVSAKTADKYLVGYVFFSGIFSKPPLLIADPHHLGMRNGLCQSRENDAIHQGSVSVLLKAFCCHRGRRLLSLALLPALRSQITVETGAYFGEPPSFLYDEGLGTILRFRSFAHSGLTVCSETYITTMGVRRGVARGKRHDVTETRKKWRGKTVNSDAAQPTGPGCRHRRRSR